jgi:hypothetical protein
MKYLKTNYPFLFHFAMRTNPFDRSASIAVKYGKIKRISRERWISHE